LNIFITKKKEDSPELPSGSYKDTCYNCSISNNILKCTCIRRDKNRTEETTLDVSRCQKVTNRDGILTCPSWI